MEHGALETSNALIFPLLFYFIYFLTKRFYEYERTM